MVQPQVQKNLELSNNITIKSFINFVDALKYHLHKLESFKNLHNIKNHSYVQPKSFTTDDISTTLKNRIEINATTDRFILQNIIGNKTGTELINEFGRYYYFCDRIFENLPKDKAIQSLIKKFREAKIDPVNGLRRLRKIVKEKFLPPNSKGECAMLTAVSMLIANPAIADNYAKLESRLKKENSLDQFNDKMKEVVKIFSSNHTRQRKDVPFALQNWIMKNRADITAVLLKEITQTLPLTINGDATSFADDEKKYQLLFIHARILRNILNEAFNMGGKAEITFEKLLTLIPDAKTKIVGKDLLSEASMPRHILLPIAKKFKDLDTKNPLYAQYYSAKRAFFDKYNKFLNDANGEFIYDRENQDFCSVQHINKIIRKSKDTAKIAKYKLMLKNPRYKIDTIDIAIPDHTFSYKHNIKDDTWSSYNINDNDINSPLPITINKKGKTASLINENNASTFYKFKGKKRKGKEHIIQSILMTRVAITLYRKINLSLHKK